MTVRRRMMADSNQFAKDGGTEVLFRNSLKSQYHASLVMLRQAVERCPDDLWTRDPVNPFWQVAYHAAFFTHLYLQPNEAAFRPWAHHREEYQFLGSLPWPPHRPPRIGEPYSRAEVLEYVAECDAMVDAAVDALDLTAGESGFWWYKMSKLEHQMVNLRHIQHHAGQLAARLRAAGASSVDWASSAPSR